MVLFLFYKSLIDCQTSHFIIVNHIKSNEILHDLSKKYSYQISTYEISPSINLGPMSRPKKIAVSQIQDLTPHPQIMNSTFEMTEDKIYPNHPKPLRMGKETSETTKQKVDFKLNSCQSVFLIVLVCILLVFLIVFVSIAIGCMVQEKSQTQNIVSQNPRASQVSKEKQEMIDQIKQQKVQISTLNNKIGDLELQLIKFQTILEKYYNQHQLTSNNQNQKAPNNQIQQPPNNSTITEKNKTTQNSQPLQNNTENKIVINITTQNQISTKNQTFQSNQTQSSNKNLTTSQTPPLNYSEASNQTKPSRQTNQTKASSDQNPQNQDKPKFRVRPVPRNGIPPQGGPRDLYQFTSSIETVVANSPSSRMFPLENSEWNGLKKPEFDRAIRLMQVVHNVNFKGQFVFDHYKFYNSAEEKYNALSKILKEEKQYYDQKYQISKYIHDQIGMCVFVPSYNNVNHRLYLRNLDSLFQQEYQNYHLVYVNDASTDGTGDYVKSYMEENQIPPEKYTIINNEVNQKNCANTYMVVHKYCNAGEIFVMLDGDDALIGRQVFALLNAIYQKEKIALTYGQFLLVRNDQISTGFSRQIPLQNLENGNFRQLRSFYSSHLKTMYVDVMREIKSEDLQYANGTFYDYAPDVTYMTPSIEMVGPRLKFLKQLVYEYRFDTGANEPHNKQIIVEHQVYTKTPYKRLESMPFADNPKTVHYP